MLRRWRLFPKYATLIALLVTALLGVSSAIGIYFAYQEAYDHLASLQLEKARDAAYRIEQFVVQIQRQMDWTTLSNTAHDEDSLAQQRIEYTRLLRTSPAISEVTWMDANGFEQLRISRFAVDRVRSGIDWSKEDSFHAVKEGKAYFGPVYFVKDTEPYITIARPALGGVLQTEVNLKYVWDVVPQIKMGVKGLAYVVDSLGTLVVHPEVSMVLKRSNLMSLPQVQSMNQGDDFSPGLNMDNVKVLSAHAPIESLQWTVFVETPESEILDAVYQPVLRSTVVLIAGLLVSVLASFYLARALARPLNILQAGAARIGAGDLDSHIVVKTGDEIEGLADQFNHMSRELKASYADLERKVDERTLQLRRAQDRSEELLHNILPRDIADELTATGTARPTRHESVSVLFTDLSGFTQTASTMPADRMVFELNELFCGFDDICDELGVEKIKTIGDAYMAAAGLPKPCADHALRCVNAGLRMVDFVAKRNLTSAFKWSMRVGIHSGQVVTGIVGKRKYAFDIWGDTVNIASRMESASEAGRVNVSAYTYYLIQEEFDCEYRGKLAAKGKGEVDMYFVSSRKT